MGYCSRSQAQTLIRAGRVRVNHIVRRYQSYRVSLLTDHVSVDGQTVVFAQPIYLMLNKPRGLVTTRSDEQGRETVYQCLTDASLPWVAPVGRLDKASEGLLLFTNDTRWAARLLDPATQLERIYRVQVNRADTDELLQRVLEGVVTNRGDDLSVVRAHHIRSGPRNSWIEIVLNAGKNRHIRRLMQELNTEVLRLVRIAIGPLQLGDLKKGGYRALTPIERKSLSTE